MVLRQLFLTVAAVSLASQIAAKEVPLPTSEELFLQCMENVIPLTEENYSLLESIAKKALSEGFSLERLENTHSSQIISFIEALPLSDKEKEFLRKTQENKAHCAKLLPDTLG